MKKSAFSKYMDREPLIVFEWHDDETDAVGWTVINSLRNGAAGGGTRMRKEVNREEVRGLAKVMELKFTVSGPKIGGAKSGIRFDPTSPDKAGVVKRWYKAVLPLLRSRYGTGGDMNLGLNDTVLPILWQYGLGHPQEGIVRGHYRRNELVTTELLHRLRTGIIMPVHGFSELLKIKGYAPTIGGIMTGYGVAHSAIWFYENTHGSIQGKKIAIEGFGEVGALAAYFLQKAGAKIVALHDQNRWIANDKGLPVLDLMAERPEGRHLPIEGTKERKKGEVIPPYFKKTDFDVYIPAAIGESISHEHLEQLPAKVIVSGANDPFVGDPVGNTKIRDEADKKVTVIPDFVANCGTARLFGILMDPNRPAMPEEKEFLSDLEATIDRPLAMLLDSNPKLTGWATAAYEHAAQELEDARKTGDYDYPV
ncbi:MAG: amino acid dehydrogenase [bacterium]|nr:amino acid dehydrogenase [bacterium]